MTTEASSLDRRVAALSDDKRNLLKARLAGKVRTSGAGESLEIPRRPEGSDIVLSFAQQRLWFLDQLVPGNPFYTESSATRFQGVVNLPALERALNEVVRRHEVLRTKFRLGADGRPEAVAAGELHIPLPVIDLGNLPASRQEQEIVRLASEEARRPFDLAQGPLLRTTLLKLGPADWIFLASLHHIVCDGWSSNVFSREVGELYTAFCARRPSPLPDLPIQYADFAHWQRNWLRAETLERQLRYWRNQLADLSVLQLPTDRPRAPVFSYLGRNYSFDLPKTLSRGLEQLAQEEGCTLFMALLAGFETVLHRYSGQDDIVVGSPIANRNRRELEPLMGFFVNILVMRGDFSGNPSHREVMRRVKATALAAFDHQDLPFERLVDELQTERNLARNPLFQVIMQLHTNPAGYRREAAPALAVVEVERTTVKFDLRVDFFQLADGLRCTVEYSTDLFDHARIERMEQHLKTVYEAMVRTPDQRVGELRLVRGAERARLMEWVTPKSLPPLAQTIDQRFAEHAARRPDGTALLLGDRSVSYGELDARATALANELARRGIGPHSIVGMTAERSIAAIVAQLGILRAGAAYLPVDPADPVERRRLMLENVGARVLIDLGGAQDRFEGMGLDIIGFRADGPPPPPAAAPDVTVTPESLAYVMYTSGSTGTPKAVGATHRGVVRLVSDVAYCSIDADETILLLAPITFDATTFEIWAPLLNGSRVAIYPEPRLSLDELHRVIERHRVSTMFLTTGLLHEIIDSRPQLFEGVRQLLFGGDVASAAHLKRLAERHPALRLVHCYGPTENTAFSTAVAIDPATDLDGPITIGRAVPRSGVYVVDGYQDLAPIGVPGELLLSGDGVSPGYIGDPQLTAERFVPDPFSSSPGRLYRTGDLARFRSDGAIEFLGRIDRQLKIRGFRVEPGEIELELARHPEVNEAVVVASQPGGRGGKRLVAYVVPRPDNGEDAHSTLRESEADLIDNWRALYDELYEDGGNATDPGFNLVGWNASDTGEPIPEAEMRQWRDATIARILERRPYRVLEIGCGSGLIALPLLPKIASYLGTDMSAPIVEQLRTTLDHAIPGRARLLVRDADDFTGIEPRQFDTVIINSVAQYFPSLDYFTRVIAGAVAATAPGGRIFLGDLRSLPHLYAFHTGVQCSRADASADPAELRRRIEKAVALEQELVLDPALFESLRATNPRISHIDIQWKRGEAVNELTRYRYDVVLHVEGVHQPAGSSVNLDWSRDDLSIELIGETLQHADADMVTVRGVPNARHAGAIQAWQLLSTEAPVNIGELRQLLNAGDPGPRFDLFWKIAEGTPYIAHIRPSLDGSEATYLCYLRRPQGDGAALSEPPPSAGYVHRSGFANTPVRSLLSDRLVPSLRRFLKDRLPEYMMPSIFVVLDAMPLTRNGKIDRAALPAPGLERQAKNESTYVAPRQEVEQRLAEIWSSVLNVERVGVNDNFFELGGDSILCLQVISRAKAAGIHLTTKQLFENQTVAALAAVAAAAPTVNAEQAPVTGTTELLPAQAWLLSQHLQGVNHFNQSVLFALPSGLDATVLDRSLRLLIRHHDALRLRCERRGESWQAFYAAPDDRPVLEHVDLSRLSETTRTAELEARCATVQAGLDIAAGPMLRAVLFKMGPARDNRLLLAAHHLVVDGVSWRILFEDLTTAYAQLSAGSQPALPAKTTSMRHWAHRLAAFANSAELQREADYWSGVPSAVVKPLPTDRSGENRVRDTDMVELELSVEETKALLTDVPMAFRAQVNDILVSAFARAIARWTGGDQAFFDLEGHGREPMFDDVDLTRTVGWFTSIFPVRLRANPEGSADAGVRAVRDQLRDIPRRGVGFGILRFLASDPDLRARLGGLPKPQISFNYMGQFIASSDQRGTIRAATEPAGPKRHPGDHRTHLIEVNGTVALERLSFEWTYSKGMHDRDTIARLAEEVMENLRAIIAASRAVQSRGVLAEEFPDARLGQDDLDRLLASLSGAAEG
jgi:amino acid adenylation domain-containing protein/non-ribosomal peptide synthase protein (TIGR01720 family)